MRLGHNLGVLHNSVDHYLSTKGLRTDSHMHVHTDMCNESVTGLPGDANILIPRPPPNFLSLAVHCASEKAWAWERVYRLVSIMKI